MSNDIVMNLWSSRLKSILGIVRAGETEHREVATMGAQVQADYHGRFIVELLQNASDQASEAGLETSTVTIVRTKDMFALANQGIPFDTPGLKSVTSLGLSNKRPQDAIGNKGIGFKSVFQITEAPEIYSSAKSSAEYFVEPGLMFRLSLTPFAETSHEKTMRDMLERELTRSPAESDGLTVDHAMLEVKAAAPFKFPLPLTPDDLHSRLRQLTVRPPGQTLVVLPLRPSPATTDIVSNAIDELRQGKGAAILFLPSVTRIRIIDLVRASEWSIDRQPAGSRSRVEGIGFFQTVRTSIAVNTAVEERHWRVLDRRIGTPDVVGSEQAILEAQSLNQYTKSFPGENWATVDNSPVGVAIPLLERSAVTNSLRLGSDGRICIGLPTKDPTGSAAWINAHFYGTISRTGTDLVDNQYNAILFDETVRLHGALVDELKASPDVTIRRAATLAFERSTGHLAARLFAPGGQAKGQIVLSSDTRSYLTPATTIVPTPEDLEALILMSPDPANLAAFAIPLPDIVLTQGARDIIISIVGGEPARTHFDDALLKRGDDGESIIEKAARERRTKGPSFWEKFLLWAVNRFDDYRLRDQRILPVGGNALASSAERVFLPPAPSTSAPQPSSEDSEISELPADLAQSLKFLDAEAVTLRKAGSRDLTPLATALAPDKGPALVRRPRLDNLINEAVGPLMQALKEDEDSRENGIRLLRQAVKWLWTLSEAGRARLTKDALRVPVTVTNGIWAWKPPCDTYFGSGWFVDPVDRLLREAYSHDPGRRICPWSDFARSFGVETEERDAWIGAMELLGVSRSPKLIRSAPGFRSAPLASSSYTELSIEWGVTCPISMAASFWRPYLETTRKRQARTASGQKFDFRTVTWIDGLERTETRVAVVELILLHHAAYETETETVLERQRRQNDDPTPVPSLWVHAITTNNWGVIPTKNGPTTPTEAWLIDSEQRGLVRRRLALLSQVREPYDQASILLKSLGVTTLRNATVARMIHALDNLGRATASYDSETKTIALALAEDMFGCLQSAYARNPGPLPDLKSLCLPLEHRKQAVGISGADLRTGYVNDDPVRAGFIPGFADAMLWPLQIRQAHRELVEHIRSQLGGSAVIYTREVPIESRFVEDSPSRREAVLEWLARIFPENPVAADVACLIAYMGRQETDPAGEEFKRTWGLFQKTVIAFGTFPADSPTPYFFDRVTNVHQVATSLPPPEILESTWMLVGSSYRDTWGAYARELERHNPAKFLADRRITPVQRENVENAIGLSSAERFNHVRAFAMALWAERNPHSPRDSFDREWLIHARSVTGICEWLGCPGLEAAFAATLNTTEEPAAITLMQAAGITTIQWQNARRALGMTPWRFTEQVRLWRECKNGLVAVLKTRAARSATASLAEIEKILLTLAQVEPPEEVCCTLANAETVLARVLSIAQEALDCDGEVPGIELLRRSLLAIQETTPVSLQGVELDEAPNRDIRVYRDDDEEKRTRDAWARFEGLMLVAQPLAANHGESVDPNSIRLDPRLAALLQGWWANCFTIMQPVQRILQQQAPKTAQRMSDERIFRDPAQANEMFQRFPELANSKKPPDTQPARRITIFGQTAPEDDVETDLLLGSTGQTGRFLLEIAVAQPATMVNTHRERETVDAPSPHGQHHGGAGRGAVGSQENKKDRELSGLLGEAFIFEYFRRILPDFDERAWRSENRRRYGLEGEANDSLGFDIEYRDIGGNLTGRADAPLCCIEVKSSSGPATSSFPMSANEWEKARACHETGNKTYIIIRVANVREKPQIADIIIDPFGLYLERKIATIANDMWVYVGAAVEQTDPEAQDNLFHITAGESPVASKEED